MEHQPDKHAEEWGWRYASASMKWYGWGSPVGLSVFFIALCTCAVLIRWGFFLLH